MAQTPDQFEELRHLILESDRENYAQQHQKILEKLDELEHELNDPEKFAGVIQKSKQEVIDVLGPVMGKMIKRFISGEIERLKQSIENRSKAIFSFTFLKQRLKNRITGVSDAEAAINDATKSTLHQIFVIDKNSGLLIGEYSPEDILEPDLIAGMLSAIKSFVESAFGEEDSELESLEYSSYKILLYNFNRFYFACVLEGFVDAEMRSSLQDDFLEVTDKYLGSISLKEINDELKLKVADALEKTFSDKYDDSGYNFKLDEHEDGH
jgi:hypothetical protein